MATRTSHHHHHQHHHHGGGDDRMPNINLIDSDEIFGSGSFEMNESDVWNWNKSEDDDRMLVGSSRKLQSKGYNHRIIIRKSLPPVNVQSKMLGMADEWKHDRIRGDEDDGEWLPPHEYLARTRMASFSVHEGFGRTLKGRDLSRVRNAIWKITGFELD